MTPQQIAYWDKVLAAMAATEEWKKELEENFWVNGYVNAAGLIIREEEAP